MKTLISVVLALFVVASVQAQNHKDRVYVPVTLSGGTTMSARTVSTTLDDTTQAIDLDGFHRVFLDIVTATNDSATILLAYSRSSDGATWGAYTLFDSLAISGTVGGQKSFELPAAVMGTHRVRLRLYGSASSPLMSGSPSATFKAIIRKKYW